MRLKNVKELKKMDIEDLRDHLNTINYEQYKAMPGNTALEKAQLLKKRIAQGELVVKNTIWYSVDNSPNTEQGSMQVYRTLEEAYKASPCEGKKYAYKIELLGEIQYELTIK